HERADDRHRRAGGTNNPAPDRTLSPNTSHHRGLKRGPKTTSPGEPVGSASHSLAIRLARTIRSSRVPVYGSVRAPRRKACTAQDECARAPSNDPRPEVREDLNRTLRGWSSSFNLGSPVAGFRSVDHYVRECVRGFPRQTAQVGRA